MSGQIDGDQLQAYTETDGSDFAVLQLAMFRRRHAFDNVSEAAGILRNMSTDMRSMFTEVEKLVRLLMVSPCSSANRRLSSKTPYLADRAFVNYYTVRRRISSATR
jgi:hypothetical protein